MMNKNHSSWLFFTGLIALFGAFITGLGEWLMLYSPEALYGYTKQHQNFLHPSLAQIKLGFFLGVIGAPVYILGYWHIAQMLKLKNLTYWIFMSLAVFGFMLGNVWLGTNAYIAFLIQAINTNMQVESLQVVLNQIESLSEPLLQVIRICVLALSGITIWKILTTKTNYPKWVIFSAPFLVIIYIFLLYFLVPSIGNYFLPAALNVAHVIFFAFSSYFAYQVCYKK